MSLSCHLPGPTLCKRPTHLLRLRLASRSALRSRFWCLSLLRERERERDRRRRSLSSRPLRRRSLDRDRSLSRLLLCLCSRSSRRERSCGLPIAHLRPSPPAAQGSSVRGRSGAPAVVQAAHGSQPSPLQRPGQLDQAGPGSGTPESSLRLTCYQRELISFQAVAGPRLVAGSPSAIEGRLALHFFRLPLDSLVEVEVEC